MRSKYILIVSSAVAAIAAVAVVVSAGNPDNPPGPPETTTSYSLEDIYDRLDSGAVGMQSAFTEPSSGPPTGTMHTLNEIMAVAPQVDDANGATAAQVLSGRTYWGLQSGAWGLQTGAMPDNGAVTIVPATTQQTIAMGYHNGSGTVEGDADLVAANIAQGVDLFGVVGTLSTYNAGVPKTGQTISYTTGDDGDLEMGVAWPSPRFITGTTGVVTDTLTGLIWLENANCFGLHLWPQALADANTLNSGECGLGDGSVEGDWRLPNVRELQSLIDYGEHTPALPDGHPFTGVQSGTYWSSTTRAAYTSQVRIVDLDDGYVNYDYKNQPGVTYYVWPVRGGQ
jgi:hypothetical protein